MKKYNIAAMVKKYLSGRFSEETEERVQKWLIKEQDKEEKEEASLAYWNALEAKASKDTYIALEKVNRMINVYTKDAASIPLYKKLRRIAAILIPLLLLAGGYWYMQSPHEQMIEIHVAYGEEKHLYLPDSSEVWINAGSTIKYPTNFHAQHRRVQLNGEAYFSVLKDENKPFEVETDRLTVRVLGTKFNLKAYSQDERAIATLTSGKIEVSTPSKESRILHPNEQLILNNQTKEINIEEISSEETSAWIRGRLIFVDASFGEIIQTLERRFNRTIIVDETIDTTKDRYTVKFIKNDSMEDILSVLEEVIGGFTYQVAADQITLTRKSV